jgi:hypothetical protein
VVLSEEAQYQYLLSSMYFDFSGKNEEAIEALFFCILLSIS